MKVHEDHDATMRDEVLWTFREGQYAIEKSLWLVSVTSSVLCILVVLAWSPSPSLKHYYSKELPNPSSFETLFMFTLIVAILVPVIYQTYKVLRTQALLLCDQDVVCSKNSRAGKWGVVESMKQEGNLLLFQKCKDEKDKFMSGTKKAQHKRTRQVVSDMRREHYSRFLAKKETGEWAELSFDDAMTAVNSLFHGERTFPSNGPGPWDVLCGTIKQTILYTTHPGNQRAFQIIKRYKNFTDENAAEWPDMCKHLVREVMHDGQGTVIRFLYRKGCEWAEVSKDNIMKAVFEMQRYSISELRPFDEATACVDDFLRALPLRGARCAVIETNVRDGVTEGALAPGTGAAADAGITTRLDQTNGYRKVYGFSWIKAPIKRVKDLVDSGNYPHLAYANSSALPSQLLRILRDKPTGTTYIKITSEFNNEMNGRVSLMQSVKLLFRRKKSAKSIETLKVEVEWY